MFEQWSDGNSVVDEFTLTQALGRDESFRRLNQHWSTFIKESDLRDIAAAGFNHVRIPIGYWSVAPRPQDPYVQGAYEFLKAACDWAGGVGLKVMIDLHGGKPALSPGNIPRPLRS